MVYSGFKQATLILLLVLFVHSSYSQRVRYNFNPGWKVFVGDDPEASKPEFNDAGWKNITLPYAWNEDDAFKKDIAELRTGIAWYRKKFRVPAKHKGQKFFLEFEGIRQAGEIYVNGRKVFLHENGVMAFGIDISPYIKTGEADNFIAVRTDNDWEYKEKSSNTKYQWEDKNFNANYGGISKNVFLHVTGPVYQTLPLYSGLGTSGVYIYADNYNIAAQAAKLHAQSEVKNESTQPVAVQYKVSMLDLNGRLVKQFQTNNFSILPGETKILSAASDISGLHFWSWGYGYLYTIQTCLVINGKEQDVVSTKTGFRKTAFKNGMIYLNDRVMQVHGYAQRTSNEWPAIGLSVPPWLSDYSNGLMVKGNANLVRWMHITPWKQDVESCDRVGLMQSMQAGDAEKDVTGRRWEQRKELMRDAIIYNRNNPSIIFYECGNESISEEHMTEMKAIRNQWDPNGGRAIGSREMLDSKVAEYGGEMLYINKSAHIPMWAMEYSRDEGLRKYWDDYSPPYHKDGDGPLLKGQPAPEYNRNQESHAIENVLRWYEYWKERPGTGTRVSSGGVNIVFSETNTHHRGAENYRRSGEVDALRIFKENYFANQVMWKGWVDPDPDGIHIIGHWNYKSGVVKPVYVVAAADKVELKVNGRSLGFGKQSNRFLFTFPDVAWQEGSITAIGYDRNNKQLSSYTIKTAGTPAAIRLTPINDPSRLRADGHDLVLVQAEVVDAKGNRCPLAMDSLQFSLDGPAEWRGGMAQGPDNFILSKLLPVECGVNRVLIRTTTNPGIITVRATAKGLMPAELKMTTVAFPVIDGLALIKPADLLTSNLEKGPTPLTPSFTVSRKAIIIVRATAGANADSAFASFDDNELSDWVNDGQLSTAWIEYQLEKPATVRSVNLKLNNFRSRIYPIRITVDGVEVFRGNTERSLGYFLAECKPTKGSKVRIQLLEPSTLTQSSATEVSGKKLDDGVVRDDANRKGTLSVIEAEIYE